MKPNKKLIAVLAIITTMLFLGAESALSAVFCNKGTLKEVAVQAELASTVASPYTVKLACEDTTPAWTNKGTIQFVFAKDVGTASYAAALTAMAADKKVSMTLAATTWNSLVTKIRILNP